MTHAAGTIETETAPIAAAVDTAMAEVVARLGLGKGLAEAMQYAALGPGKRVRPVLCVLAARACAPSGLNADATAMPAAVAVELVHAFSLVHDDLPALDDDDMRRGRPTLHVHTGEAMALLAGDGMLAAAFEVLARAPELDHAVTARLVGELSAATRRMVDGQVYDTLGGFDAALNEEQRLRLTHELKTGALLSAACRMGAIAAGADEANLAAITAYAERIGLMFQIVDDLLDVEQSAEQIGKRTGKDEEAGKLTFPGVLGVEASRIEIERLGREAESALDPLGEAAGPLRSMAVWLSSRTR